jgi:hypothetical protein
MTLERLHSIKAITELLIIGTFWNVEKLLQDLQLTVFHAADKLWKSITTLCISNVYNFKQKWQMIEKSHITKVDKNCSWTGNW